MDSIKTDYIDDNISSFEDLNLKEELLRGIYSYGFEQPSKIQKKAIKPVLDKNLSNMNIL